MTTTQDPRVDDMACQALSAATMTAAGPAGLASGFPATVPPELVAEVAASTAPAPATTSRLRYAAASVAYGIAGFALLGVLWQFGHSRSDALPAPLETLEALRTLLTSAFDPTTDAGPGIGLQLRDSLVLVLKGFAMAALVGIPLGFLLGTNRHAWRMMNPVVQLLRPVSPLAWYPVMLALLTKAAPAAQWVIFITALWPTVINTAAGAASVPSDQHDVARVFKFSKWTALREIVVPHTIPSVITGLRLSMGIAWMVIVAAEMVSAATGIGFFIWQSYNGAGITHVLSAIILIGLIGVVIDQLFVTLGRKLAPEVSQ